MTLANEVIESRLAYIKSVMARQKLKGNPRKYIVLEGGNRIRDWDMDYELKMPDIPLPCPIGTVLWIALTADMVKIKVVADAGMGKLWCTYADHPHKVEFVVERSECYVLPLPVRSVAILRNRLVDYLGPQLASEWHRKRALRHGKHH